VAAAIGLVGLAVAGELIGATRFDAYPRLEAASGAGLIAIAVALVACALAPFLDRRGIGR
jgi:multisubunit Na+/H+ antiporter MnhG subunit